MKEVISRKTGKVNILSDEEWDQVVNLALAGRYRVTDIPAVRQIKPDLKITVETKKSKPSNNI